MTPGGNSRPVDLIWPSELVAAVSATPPAPRVWVAFSGGLDSTLLLHAAHHCFDGDIAALHINHQLQPNAGECETHCRAVCRELGVELVVEAVDVGAIKGVGLEESARNERYRVFETRLGPDEALLMAHHGDDQTETVLFRLVRGTGVAGLAGMPVQRPLGEGFLFRPLLAFGREQLCCWAAELGLQWIDDPSNDDQRFDRNFLRHSILQPLKLRWPTLLQRLGHTVEACREADQLAYRLAQLQYASCADARGAIGLAEFRLLSLAEQKNLLRWSILERGWTLPSVKHWDQALVQMATAKEDRAPEIKGDGFSIRRYRDALYLVAEPEAVPTGTRILSASCPVEWGSYRFCLETAGQAETAAPELEVKARAGGERIRPDPTGPSRLLKTWLQETAVPPWQRQGLPLLWEAGNVVGVADLWLSPRFSGEAPVSGWRIRAERDFN
ncbi:tRNA lysidine(34) synthetase TilS [Marinobacter changyiensis]|uniref:tRNA lysidine(34) synthetase TilS n=1 Tax=Marinobacter changyiensis TaxID=2604091 RepID=UPI001264F6D0|nr:tRNA lysidine(34) synthetase TilS [Marinobacter changyiensis]